MNKTSHMFHSSFFALFLAVAIASPYASLALDASPVFFVEGTLYDLSGNPLEGNVSIIAQITNDDGLDSSTCVLYEEEVQNIDLTGQQGYFQIGVGETRGSGDPGLAPKVVFANTGERLSSLTNVASNPCSYTSASGEKRLLRLLITTSGGSSDILNVELGSTPSALVAESLQGHSPQDFIKVNSTSNLTQTKLEAVFNDFNELQALINGTSTQYATRSSAGASQLPQFTTAGAPSSPAGGDFWYDSDTNEIKFYNGSEVKTVGTSDNTLPAVGIAGTYTKVTTDTNGRVTSGTTLDESDIPLLTSDGNGVDGGAISTGTIGGDTAINTSGNITTSGTISATGNVRAGSFSGRSISIYDSDNSNYVRFMVPENPGDYTLTLPGTAGNSGDILTTDGSGTLSWTSASPTSVTSIFGRSGVVTAQSGDYTASQITNAPAGGVTATTVQAAIDELDTDKQNADADLTGLAGLSTNGLVERTAAGTFTTNTVTAAGKALLDDASASAQRTTLGLGTIATQDSNSVAITGGAIDGTAIGGTTPARGDFTTLDSSGNASVGGTLSVTGSATLGGAFTVAGDTSFSGNVDVAAGKTVGIGTFTNAAQSTLVSGLVSGDEGQFWYNSDTDTLMYWNGSSAAALGVSGAGLQSISGDTTNAQTLSISNGAAVKAPAWNHDGSGDHELRLPLASSAGVTHGLISKTDYDNFNNKQSNTLNDGQILIGNGSNVATGRIPSGDISMNNIGVFTLATSGVTGGTYKSVTVDAKGRVTAGTNPTSLSGYGITDAIENAGGLPSIEAGADASKGTADTAGRLYVATDTQKIYRDTGSNWELVATTNASDISSGTLNTARLPASGVTAGTYKSVTVDAKGRVTSATNPTTISGFGITDAVANAGDTPSIQAGLNASKPAFGTAGRLYISTDTQEIYRDSGAAWVLMASVAAAGGSVDSVGATAPLSNTGTAADPVIALSGTVPLANGGTGATTASGARTNLGLGTAAVADVGGGIGELPQVTTAFTTDAFVHWNNTAGGLEPFTCSVGEYLQYSAGGWGCVDSATDTAAFHNGGDSFGGLATLGTNDDYGLAFETNGTERMRISKGGKIGIGTTTPGSTLSLGDGFFTEGGIIARGYGTRGTDGDTLPVMGQGTRMVWYPKKAAFRAGYLTNGTYEMTYWNDLLIGIGSIALGQDVKASGAASFSIGKGSKAEGDRSGALGDGAYAKETSSIAIGNLARSYSSYSYAIGNKVQTADDDGLGGINSIAIAAGKPGGNHRQVTGDNSVGIFVGDTAGLDLTEDNSFAILGGNVGIGASAPQANLHIVQEGNPTQPGILLTGANNNGSNYLHFENSHTTPLASGIMIQKKVANDTYDEAAIIYQHQDQQLHFYAGENDSDGNNHLEKNQDVKMVVGKDGRVGIGTLSPSEQLHVVGNLRVEGSTDCTLGNGSGGTNCTSDLRLKTDIKPIENSLQKILSLKGVDFKWNGLASTPGRKDIGVIAQDVQKQFPTAVIDDKDGYKKVDYAVLVAPIIEAIKELWQMVDDDKSDLAQTKKELAQLKANSNREINSLKEKNEALSHRLDELLSRLESLEKQP